MSAVAETLPPGILNICEAASLAPGSAVADDGTVQIHLIRPCVGKGRGRHVYEAAMLKQHAESGHFDDWRMFVDHESPEARRRAGGLPRSFRDLGGRVVETHWDPAVPAEGRFEQGAVVAKVLPVPWIQEMIRNDPKLAAVSVNTHATGVKPTTRGGRPAYIVEGFDDEGSVDWVTRAGAGGKVVQLLEAAYPEDDHMDDEHLHKLLETVPDDTLSGWLRESRPAVAEALQSADHGEEDEDVTKDQIREAVLEALRSDEARTIIQEAQTDETAVKDQVTEALREVLPTAIGKAAGVIEEQAIAGAKHAVRMSALRTQAVETVQEAQRKGLPERFGQDVLERIGTPDLEDVLEGEGDEAKVTETAEQQFEKLLEAEMERAQEMVKAARPEAAGGKGKKAAPAKTTAKAKTAVTENGDGGEGTHKGDPVEESEATDEPNPHYRHELKEAGVDVFAAYGIGKPPAKDKGEPVEA